MVFQGATSHPEKLPLLAFASNYPNHKNLFLRIGVTFGDPDMRFIVKRNKDPENLFRQFKMIITCMLNYKKVSYLSLHI